eukprot:2093691-Amphidinium_carterae.1
MSSWAVLGLYCSRQRCIHLLRSTAVLGSSTLTLCKPCQGLVVEKMPGIKRSVSGRQLDQNVKAAVKSVSHAIESREEKELD